MKSFSKKDIKKLDQVFRLNLINSVNGYKSANLIGTKGKHGENLAVFSSVFHLGFNPALLGLIMRPATVPRNSLSNILATKKYTINSIHQSIAKQAHYTSAKFKEGVSEFEYCKLTPEYLENFEAPFVKESKLKMAMNLEQKIDIEINGTILIIGSIENLIIEEKAIRDNGQLDLPAIGVTTISGLNRYNVAEEIGKFPYARVNETPSFEL